MNGKSDGLIPAVPYPFCALVHNSELSIPTEKIGAFDTQLVYEFMWAFAANARLTLHLRKLAGRNSHHIVEGAFKALGRALREAAETDPRFRDEIPSTKGML